MNTIHLKTAAKKIAASLRYARNNAVSEHLITIAHFDFEKNEMSILVQNETEAGLNSEVATTHGEYPGTKLGDDEKNIIKSKVYDLPKGVRFEKAITLKGIEQTDLFEILFYPGGNSSGGEITLINEKGKQYSVKVDFITGTVRLVE